MFLAVETNQTGNAVNVVINVNRILFLDGITLRLDGAFLVLTEQGAKDLRLRLACLR